MTIQTTDRASSRERGRRPAAGARFLLSTAWMASLALGWSGPASSAPLPAFSSERAMETLVEICAFGPRVPGSEAHANAIAYCRERLVRNGGEVFEQPFTAQPEGFAAPVRMRNLIGRFAPEKRERVLVGAHIDSRPWADEEPDSSLHATPVLGANDSASGCAVLLVLSDILAAHDAAYGVDLVFFDGEDLGQPGVPKSYCLGSQEYVRRMDVPPLYVVILDMIGDKDLQIYPERYAAERAPQLTLYVWERARRLGLHQFRDGRTVPVYDDHVAFLDAGLPAVDLIDFDYPHWHKTTDTPDRCSAESLGAVGELMVSLLYQP